MKEIELQLNIHTPWSKYTETKIKDCECDISFYEKFMNTKHHFDCTDFCKIDIANDGKIFIRFLNEQSEKELREYTAILLYFISICNGYNCEYYEWAVIDNIFYPRFFNYAKEDDMGLPSYKKEKFYQISLQDIDAIFGKIISHLFSMNRRYIMMLLSNYYATIVYKDFINNGEYRFRNIVTNIESLVTIINKKQYDKVKEDNIAYLNTIVKLTSISKKELGKYLMPKSTRLEDKLRDCFELADTLFGLKLKRKLSKECTKIANTRNLISHAFDTEKELLSDEERIEYTATFEELFRMFFLFYCGIDKTLIAERFTSNLIVRQRMKYFYNQ